MNFKGYIFLCFLCSTSASYNCTLESICQAVCNCIPSDTSPTMLAVQCHHLVTGNNPFFQCLGNNVTELYIYGSDILQLLENEMDNLTSLVTMKIEDSPIAFISPTAFIKLSSLQHLYIQNTNLSSLDIKTFTNLPLITLEITGSNIWSIGSQHLDPLIETLTYLDLSDNKINDTLQYIFLQNNILQTVDFSGNKLTTIDIFLIQYLYGIRSLNFARNQIETIGYTAIANLKKLTNFDVSGNKISRLLNGLFEDSPLQVLNLSWNQFDAVPTQAICNNVTLQILDMDGNKIKSLTKDSLNHLESVQELHLSHMTTLKSIGNQTFARLPVLERLYLFDNKRLSSMSASAFESQTNLQYLYVNDNSLTQLNNQMFIDLPALIEVQAHGNPFHCSCYAIWIRLAMDSHINKWIQHWKTGDTAVRCAIPKNFNQTLIYHYNVYDLTCDPPVVRDQHQYTEVNGNHYYMEVHLDRGLPTTTWTVHNTTTLNPGEVYDQLTGKDIISVEEIVSSDNIVQSRLIIKNPTIDSQGHYTMSAQNAGGLVSVDFYFEPAIQRMTWKIAAIVVGCVIGVVIISVILVCIILKKRPFSYKRMETTNNNVTKTE